MTKTVKTQCATCGGTGLTGIPTDATMLARDAELVENQPGLASEAVVCETCEGAGCKTISYVPFRGRKILSHIRTVLPRRPGCTMTYSEFIRTTPEPSQD